MPMFDAEWHDAKYWKLQRAFGLLEREANRLDSQNTKLTKRCETLLRRLDAANHRVNELIAEVKALRGEQAK